MTRRGLFDGMILAAVAALLAFSSPAVADPLPDVFSVTVPVDATAASADAAREAARLEGERDAYTKLLQRLTLAKDQARLPPPTDAMLNDVIQDFEVSDERHSTVRYLANYTFRFRPDLIEQLLRSNNIPFAVTPSKPVLVLPVIETAKGPVLWDDPNPWRDAWNNATLPQGLVPMTAPLGGIEDLTAIDAAQADSGDDTHLQAIAKNYGGADVLVARATLKQAQGGETANVTSTRFTPGDPSAEQTWVASYAANPGESEPDFLARAVAGTASQVVDAWKQANIIDFSQSGTLVVTIPTGALADWITVRNRLADIPSIQQIDLLSLDRQQAQVELHYVGDQQQLQLALAQRNLNLSGADPNWVLQRSGAATAPPPASATAPAASSPAGVSAPNAAPSGAPATDSAPPPAP